MLRGATVGICALIGALTSAFLFDVVATWSHAWPARLGALAAFSAIGAAIGWWRSQHARHQPARALEHVVPSSKNLLVTASELLTTNSAPSAVSTMVLERADQLASSLRISALLPLEPVAKRLLASLVVWILAVMAVDRFVHQAAVTPAQALLAAVTGRVEVQRVNVRVTPPRYTQRDPVALRDPARIEALIGSTVAITINASADSLVITTRDSTRVLARDSSNAFTLSLPATLDGFIAIEPRNNKGITGTRRLIGLTVRSDEAPRVRIVAPAKDMIIPDSKRTLDVRVEADDDLALGSLKLRYTKVSGSGERFTFSEGEVPVAIGRSSAAQWTARAALALEPLLIEPGDLVVYRAVATDNRPGSLPIESDAFIAELAAPGGIAALGFSLDPDEDRYALSQQMVILKTERLIAKKSSMTAAAIAEEATQLAGEQRRVRAEFVFMMGGEFAQEVTVDAGMDDLDETHEAESESDLSAGRMQNRGRSALLAAVRAMSRAAMALTVSNLDPALRQEKTALNQLQEAFARSRFLMRALSQREQLDLTRRLTGKLDSVATGRSPVPAGERDAQHTAWTAIFAELITVAQRAPLDGARLSLLAERVLQTDATSPAAQKLSAQLSAASDAIASGSAASTRTQRLLDSAATGLTTLLRSGARPAAHEPFARSTRRLQSDLDAALKSARAGQRP